MTKSRSSVWNRSGKGGRKFEGSIEFYVLLALTLLSLMVWIIGWF